MLALQKAFFPFSLLFRRINLLCHWFKKVLQKYIAPTFHKKTTTSTKSTLKKICKIASFPNAFESRENKKEQRVVWREFFSLRQVKLPSMFLNRRLAAGAKTLGRIGQDDPARGSHLALPCAAMPP